MTDKQLRSERRKRILARARENTFKTFLRISSNGGLLLLCVGFIALVWANSPLQGLYQYVFEKLHISFSVNTFTIDMHTLHWINDGLMAIFFFMVGLEIKREMFAGELANLKVATLPIFGAIGGMIVPIIIYSCFGLSGESARGWGIPMATDIAFSIGILTLLGKRVPLNLKIFLTALAIVDDLGAVLVIAIFYTTEIQWVYLLSGLALIGVLMILNRRHYKKLHIFLVIGMVVWWLFLQSGIHATIAGVLVAFTIPMRTHVKSTAFVEGISETLHKFDNIKEGKRGSVVLSQEQVNAVDTIHYLSHSVQSPLQYLENSLHKFVNYIIMPLFALANSGVILYSFSGEQPELVSLVTFAIAMSLFAGKTIGIAFFSWIAVQLRLADKPEGTSWRTMIGMGMMGGIGFTMSLFIAGLAFTDHDILSQAKLGIFIGSILSGVCGYIFLRWSLSKDQKETSLNDEANN